MKYTLIVKVERGKWYALPHKGINAEFLTRGRNEFEDYYFFRNERGIYGLWKPEFVKEVIHAIHD